LYSFPFHLSILQIISKTDETIIGAARFQETPPRGARDFGENRSAHFFFRIFHNVAVRAQEISWGHRAARISRGESPQRSCARTGGFYFAIVRHGAGGKGDQQHPDGRGNPVNGALKSGLVDFRRLRESRNLSYELQRRTLNLRFRGGRIEIVQGFDVSTHDQKPSSHIDIPLARSAGNSCNPN
jgi:hypothetical protein